LRFTLQRRSILSASPSLFAIIKTMGMQLTTNTNHKTFLLTPSSVTVLIIAWRYDHRLFIGWKPRQNSYHKCKPLAILRLLNKSPPLAHPNSGGSENAPHCSSLWCV
jgi:hypothetical protein